MEVRGGQIPLCGQCFKGVGRVEGEDVGGLQGGEVGVFEGGKPGCS